MPVDHLEKTRISPTEVRMAAKDLDVKPEAVREMEGRLASHDAGFDAAPGEDDESSWQAPVH